MITLSKKVILEKFENELVLADFATGLYYSAEGTIISFIEALPADEKQLVAVITSALENDTEGVALFYECLERCKARGVLTSSQDTYSGELTLESIILTPSVLNEYDDMQDLLALDPIHEVDESGWPKKETSNESN